MLAQSMRNNNEILDADQTTREENFIWSTMNADAQSVCVCGI